MKKMLQTSWGATCGLGNRLVLGLVAVALLALGSMHEAMAQASAYVDQMEDAATQMTTDLAAALPIALGVAVVSVGIFIVWRVFKRLANG